MAAGDVALSSESSRGNGWSLPLHALQVCGWLAVLIFMFIYFSTMVPVLPTHWQPAAYIVSFHSIFFFSLCVCVCVFHFNSIQELNK
jgi:hypothetical protein